MSNVSMIDGHIDRPMTNYERIKNMSVEEMAEYINREELLKYKEEMWQDRCDHMVVRVTNIMYLPKEYVVSVVRCKDCKYCGRIDDIDYVCERVEPIFVSKDHYCSYGERKQSISRG